MNTLRGMLTNWKTTLAGVVFAVVNLSYNGVTVKQILISAAIAYLGAMSKDHNGAK